MTTQTVNEQRTTATQNQPDQSAPEPTLPELYRLLSDLIQDPPEFFEEVIQIRSTEGRLAAVAWHLDQPIITARTIPSPLSPAQEERPSPTARPVEITTGTESEAGKPPATLAETLLRHFDAALLQRTRDLLNQHATRNRAKALDDRQWNQPLRASALLAAVKCVFYAASIAESLETYVDELAERLHEGLQQKLETAAVEFAAREMPQVGLKPSRAAEPEQPDFRFPQLHLTLSQYNKAALLLACTEETRQANAGAVPWMLSQTPTRTEVRHQGQLIGAERSAAIYHGMSAAGWRHLTHLNPDLTRRIVQYSDHLEQAAQIINWLASLNGELNLTRLLRVLQESIVRQAFGPTTDRTEPTALHHRNLRHIAALAAQTTPQERDQRAAPTAQETGEASDALTYVNLLSANDKELTAKTWKGLLKAVSKWHKRINQQQTQFHWEQIVKANNGVIRAWPPTLPEFEHLEVKATELTDENMLLAEALEMNHCVHTYGARAARGEVRIFSLQDAAGRRATASLLQRQGDWRLEQTRGYKNHPTPEEMTECARMLTQACNEPKTETAGPASQEN